MLLKFIELLSCGGGAVSVASPLSSCGIEQSGSSSDSYSEVVGSNPTPAILSNRINIIIRMCKNLVKISKEDAKTLNKEYGIPYGSYGISHTDSCSHKRKTYYLCTSFKNMKAYNAIRAKRHEI